MEALLIRLRIQRVHFSHEVISEHELYAPQVKLSVQFTATPVINLNVGHGVACEQITVLLFGEPVVDLHITNAQSFSNIGSRGHRPHIR